MKIKEKIETKKKAVFRKKKKQAKCMKDIEERGFLLEVKIEMNQNKQIIITENGEENLVT